LQLTAALLFGGETVSKMKYPETPSALANTPPASLLVKKASSPPLAAWEI